MDISIEFNDSAVPRFTRFPLHIRGWTSRLKQFVLHTYIDIIGHRICNASVSTPGHVLRTRIINEFQDSAVVFFIIIFITPLLERLIFKTKKRDY